MKHYLISMICLLLSIATYAQSPQSFQYQAVVRDVNGNALVNQPVNFQLSIIIGALPGSVEYVETHSTTTNAFGIVTLAVGNGTPVTNLFSDINWSVSPHYIKVEADPTGGTTYLDMGTIQLLSVPYSLYAETAGNAGQTYTSGTGINITGNVISNTDPGSAINLIQGGSTTISGTYPNITISSTDNNTTYTGGTGINVSGTTITNTLPDQAVTLTQGGATTISGTYPNYTISSTDNNSGTPGGLNKTIQFNNSGSFGGDTAMVWDNTNKRLGVGLTNPTGRVVIKGSATAPANEPLFEIKNTLGQQVMAVYNDSVHFFITDIASNQGGFAVSGRSNSKAFTNDFLRINPDSTRIYTGDTIAGFGVENLGTGSSTSYMQLSPNNYFIGHEAGKSTTSGLYNSFIGYKSGINNTSGFKNYFIGYKSGYNNNFGYSNIFIGDSAGFSNDSAYKNIFIGNQSGFANMRGNYNVFLGYNTGYHNLESYNVFIGYKSGYQNTYGMYNVANGFEALLNNTYSDNNVAVGNRALYSNTGGDDNTGIGFESMYSNTTGYRNVACGKQSMHNNVDGYANVAIGDAALYINTNGHNNVAVGYSAMFANNTGIGNTALGNNAFSAGGAYSNSTAVGNNANMNASNKIRLGNAAVTVIEGQVAYTFPSDGRFKYNVTENVKGLEFIDKLRPVVYQFDTKKFDEFLLKNIPDSTRNKILEGIDYTESSGIKHTGFIAQEVEQAAKECGFAFDGINVPKDENGNYGVAYSQFTIPLVKAVQELNEKNTLLSKEIDDIKKLNIDQKLMIDQLNKRIENLENK